MFNLILALISIVLVVGLAVYSIFFMSGTTQRAAEEASTTQVISSASQIAAAVNLYENEHAGAPPTGFNDLTFNGYLRSIPKGQWAFSTNAILSSVVVGSLSSCQAVNKKLYGDATVPTCASVDNTKIICCSN